MTEMNLTLAIRGTVSPEIRKAIRDINAINAKLVQDQKRQAQEERKKATETRRTSKELKGQISTLSRLESAHQKNIKTQRQGLSIARSTLKGEKQRLSIVRQTLAASQKLGTAKGQGAFTAGGAGSTIAQATRNMQSLDKSSRNVSRGMQKLDRDAAGAGQSIQDVGRFSEFAFSVLNAFLLYKGFVFLKTSAEEFVREIVEMQHQIAVTQGMLSGLGKDFKQELGDVVMRVSRETGQALGDLARAQYTIISGGVTDIEESFDALNLAAKAAVAGGIRDVDTAFGAALSQIRAFGLEMSELEEVFDKQFLLIRRGIFTFENFATSVGTLSESFSSMGQDMETANASLVAISQVFTGPQLQRGATALRNAVLQINRASEEFEGLGVEVFDAEGNFRNFLTIVEDLDSALEGMTDKERRKAMEDLFPDKRQMAGMNVLLSNLDVAKESFIEQQFAMGALDDEFDSVNDSLQVQAGIFRNELIPAAEPLVAVFGAAIKGVNSLNDEFEGFTKTVGLLTVAILGLTAAHGALNTQAATGMLGAGGIRGVKGGIGALIGASTAAAGATQGFSGAGLATAAGVGAAGGGMIGGPIGALVGAGLNSAIFGISTKFHEEGENAAQSFTDRFEDAITSRAGDIGMALADALSGGARNETFEMLQDVAGTQAMSFRRAEQFASIEKRKGLERFDIRGILQDLFAGTDPIDETEMARTAIRGGTVEDAAKAARLRALEFDEIFKPMVEQNIISHGVARETRAFELNRILEQALPDFDDEGLQREQEARRRLAEMLVETELSTQGFGEALDILADEGVLPFFDFINQEVTAAKDKMPRTFDDIADFMKAPFADVADVFASMGDSGDLLAREFNELARISSRLKNLQMLQTLAEALSVDSDVVDDMQREIATNAGESIKNFFEDPDAIKNFLDASEAVETTTEVLHPFAQEIENLTNEMKTNSLESKRIQAKAKMQNRDLTAEEQDRINRLDMENVQLEINQNNLQDFGDALVDATKAVEGHTEKLREGSQSAQAGSPAGRMQGGVARGGGLAPGLLTDGSVNPHIQMGGSGRGGLTIEEAMSVNAVRHGSIANPQTMGDTLLNMRRGRSFGRLAIGTQSVDPMTMGLISGLGVRPDFKTVQGRGSNVSETLGFRRETQAIIQAVIQQISQAQQRGVNINFNGDTVPSELDMRIRQLEDLAPILARETSRTG